MVAAKCCPVQTLKGFVVFPPIMAQPIGMGDRVRVLSGEYEGEVGLVVGLLTFLKDNSALNMYDVYLSFGIRTLQGSDLERVEAAN